MGNLSQKYTTKNAKKSTILHSSGYARVQSGNKIGVAAPGESFETRQKVEERRKYVQKYRNSRILQRTYGIQRAKTYVPRVEKDTTDKRGCGSLSTQQSSSTPTGTQPPLPPTAPTRQVSPISLPKR